MHPVVQHADTVEQQVLSLARDLFATVKFVLWQIWTTLDSSSSNTTSVTVYVTRM